MNTTAICITLIICATLVLLSLINKTGSGSRGKENDSEEKEGDK